jgi:hypothetical protein
MRSAASGLELKQPRDLRYEAAVLQIRNSPGKRCPPIAVDEEQFAAGSVLPAKTGVRRNGLGAGLILHQRGVSQMVFQSTLAFSLTTWESLIPPCAFAKKMYPFRRS